MIKIKDVVKEIVISDDEALYALVNKYMNLSAYAKQIQKRVEDMTFKDVEAQGIVVALSRIQKEFKDKHPLVEEVAINNLTTKSPLSEIVFEKNSAILDKLSDLYKKVKTTSDDFLTMTLSTTEITVICSDRILEDVLKALGTEPKMQRNGLASLGLSFNKKYYDMPNIGYSLLRKIAQKRIVLAEMISSYTECIFVFDQKDLPEMLKVFQK